LVGSHGLIRDMASQDTVNQVSYVRVTMKTNLLSLVMSK